MKKRFLVISAASLLVISLGVWAQQMTPLKSPTTFALNCPGGDCPLLKGAPQTSGMRGGSVKLKPGESVGWHSTNDNEEALIILHGSGTAHFEGNPDVSLSEKTLAYIPPHMHHDVTNTGSNVLEYVWIVAPAAPH